MKFVKFSQSTLTAIICSLVCLLMDHFEEDLVKVVLPAGKSCRENEEAVAPSKALPGPQVLNGPRQRLG